MEQQPQITIEKVHQIIGKLYMDANLREEQLIKLLQQQSEIKKEEVDVSD